MKLIIAFLLIILTCNVSTAQDPDTLSRDSLRLYQNIKEIAKKRKATYWIYKAIFKDPSSIKHENLEKKQQIEKNKYLPYKGKIIRRIDIISLDPFGTKLNDTIADTDNPIEKFGNELHVSTKDFAIKDNLLFKAGDPIDPLEVKESERILRQLGYIREAKIEIFPIAGSDSADVFIAVQDLWSLQGSVFASTSKSRLSLNERNFAGSGHNLNNTFNFNFKEKPSFFISGNYTVPNVRHTFVSSSIYYNTSNLNKYIGLNLQRPFYSAITEWAGGLNVMKNRIKLLTHTENGIVDFENIKYGYEDLWIGRSIRYKKGESDEDRGSRLVIAARIMNSRYSERPTDTYLREIYQNATLILGSVGLSTRIYYKDWNIYKFSQTEDVPEGRLIALTAGVQKRELADRSYLGFEVSAGSKIMNFGYLLRSIQIGSFINFSKVEDGTIKTELSYFTDLVPISNWSLRQFVRYRFTHGFNLAPHINLNLNDVNGLFGFNSPVLIGTTKMVLNLETVVYLPYSVLGFQFAPILSGGFGLIGNEENTLIRSKLYQFYGLGVLIRNELLIASNFQLSIGFYPVIPGVGISEIKFNPIKNYNYNFREFYLAQPAVVSFN
jgi:hypothetical protein